jgi:hypothetical protein
LVSGALNPEGVILALFEVPNTIMAEQEPVEPQARLARGLLVVEPLCAKTRVCGTCRRRPPLNVCDSSAEPALFRTIKATRLSVANYNMTLSSERLETGTGGSIHFPPPYSPSVFTLLGQSLDRRLLGSVSCGVQRSHQGAQGKSSSRCRKGQPDCCRPTVHKSVPAVRIHLAPPPSPALRQSPRAPAASCPR